MKAAAAIRVVRGAKLIPSADSELKELVLFSRENDADRARDAVIDVYQRLRREAGLDAQTSRVVSLERTARKGSSRHRFDVSLMNEATRVLKSESHLEWAVVLAQTACEVYVCDILERRAAQLGDAAIDVVARLPGANLASERVRRVFHRSRAIHRTRPSGGLNIRPTRSAVTESFMPVRASPAKTPRIRSRPRRP